MTLLTLLDVQTLLVFTVVLLATLLYRSTRLPRSFPPGPRPLPIIGNLALMAGTPLEALKTMTSLRDKYGAIIGLKLGSLPTVLLSSAEAVKEALVEKADDFSARPHFMYYITEVSKREGKVRGVIWQNGDIWRESRRFSLSSMRDFGLGKRSIEDRMCEEADAMCSELISAAGQPYDVFTLTQQATSNVICGVCFGTRFEYTDPEFIEMMESFNFYATSPVFTSIYNFIPALRYLPIKGLIDKSLATNDVIIHFIDRQIENHRPSFDPQQPRDFLDLYLIKEKEGRSTDEAFSKLSLLGIIGDLFFAGTETSSTSIRWLLLYMVHYPNIQKRCQEEIDHVVGSGRRPTLSDRADTPYVEATILEMQRLCNVVPFSVPHATERDTTLSGYHIPKDTLVMVNLYAVNTDPRYWEEPMTFNPDRWLGDDGKVCRRESFMPFSAGPRLCLGDSLAKNELYIFFSFLLQRFTFSMVDPANPPSLEGLLGVTLAPAKYHIIANLR